MACLGIYLKSRRELRINATPSATHDDRVDERTDPVGLRMPDKEPALFPNGTGSDRVLGAVVINLAAPIAKISLQAIILVEEVADGAADRTPWQELRL